MLIQKAPPQSARFVRLSSAFVICGAAIAAMLSFGAPTLE